MMICEECNDNRHWLCSEDDCDCCGEDDNET